MSRSFFPRLPAFAALTAGALLLPTPVVRATAYNWINPNGGSWTTATNFSPSSTGTTSADTINFNGSGTTTTAGTIGGNNSTGVETISLDAAQAIGGLTFFNTGGTSIVGNADPMSTTVQTLSFLNGGTFLINTGVGPVTLGSTVAINFTGNLSTTTFTNNSSSLFTLASALSNSGGAAGGNALGFNISGIGNTLLSGAIVPGVRTSDSTSTTVQVQKNGTGTLTITGANTAVARFIITGGSTVLDATAGGSINASANFNMGAGSFTLLGNSGGTTAQVFAATTVTGSGTGGGTILVDGGTANAATSLNLGASVASNAGSSLNLTTARGGTVSVTGSNLNNVIGAGHVIYNGTDFASKLTNGSSSTLAGTIGALPAASTTALPATTGSGTANYLATDNFTQTGNVVGYTLKVTDTTTSQSLAQAGFSLAVTTGGILFTGANDYTVSGGTVTVNSTAAATDLVMHQYGAGTLNVSSAIVNANAGSSTTSLTKAGPGTLSLSGASTYTGTTYVNGGTLVTTSSGINSATGGMAISNPGTVFAPVGGTVLTPGVTGATQNQILVNNGATLAPAGVGTIGMLTLNGAGSTGRILSMGVGSHFAFDLGAGNTSDNVTFLSYTGGSATTNDFALNGSQVRNSANVAVGSVVFDFTGAQAGTYTLFSFYSDAAGATPIASALNGTYFDLTDSTGLNGFSPSLAFNTGSITLTLTAVPEPSTWVSGALAVAVGVVAWRRTRRRTGNATA